MKSVIAIFNFIIILTSVCFFSCKNENDYIKKGNKRFYAEDYQGAMEL